MRVEEHCGAELEFEIEIGVERGDHRSRLIIRITSMMALLDIESKPDSKWGSSRTDGAIEVELRIEDSEWARGRMMI